MRTILVAAAMVCVLSASAWSQASPAPPPDDAVTSTPTVVQEPPSEPPAAQSQAPTSSSSAAAPASEDAEGAEARQAQEFYDSLHRQTGAVLIADGKVQLVVPQSHYFLGKEDSRRVLVDVWRNPPEAAQGIEGMLFEDGANPAVDAWGAVIEYHTDGYVSDSDANSTNYTELLHQMQQDVQSRNADRHAHGYPEITLVGWAEPPHYDGQTHKAYWARELAFSDSQQHGLNYDIRVLGRGGVLSVNFIAGMSDLPAIRAAAPAVMAIPTFTQGNRYADYQSGVDPKASYGIAGLIAGGAAVAIAQKTGLLALLLVLAKKFFVVIIAGLAAMGSFLRKLFGGKDKANITTGSGIDGGGDPKA